MKYVCVFNDSVHATAAEERNGRWYISMGFCGFNSPANNRSGYDSEAKANAACMRYQRKSPRLMALVA